ncbi:YifB family Mg chelatase-like AAA ATPase [Schaalia sp. ZJ405]|uniref:YifB family Mg chelatase-like AAA ATPase n=1 Tax=Schaalia sp. ZJ405 TaxID=2709403 RepID=UPI002F2B2454
MPDASLREAKDRVRSALQSCGIEVINRRITVNLSPAGLPKSGSGFDAAIAASVLMAAGKLPQRALDRTVIIGELGLDGSMRAVPGVLPALVTARSQGITRAIVPAESAAEARLVSGIDVDAFEHCADMVNALGGRAVRPVAYGGGSLSGGETSSQRKPVLGAAIDLSDVRGQDFAVNALTIAAAGGHHVFLVGQPGSGKTMLAARLPTILPQLDDEAALTVTSLHSIAGVFRDRQELIRTPPLQAPHHSATMAAMIGGGSVRIIPGAVSLAHAGVLFLDEAAEFPSAVLNALRQPLEEGIVTIHRVRGSAQFPARVQLILAANPCPCGGGRGRGRACTCSSIVRRRYLARLSGPLLDRIDITIGMRVPTRADLARTAAPSSSLVRDRVAEARQRAIHRLKDTPWRLNAEVPGRWVREHSGIDTALVTRLDRAIDQGSVSMRGADRVLRLMWTLADMDERRKPHFDDLAHALTLRTGGPDGADF